MTKNNNEDPSTPRYPAADEDGSELSAAAGLACLVNQLNATAGVEDSKNGDIDHADDEDDESKELSIPQKLTKSGRKRAVPFPLKLMKVLSCKEYHHIISWMPSGKSFMILKPKLFTNEILPEHFKTAKFSSFTRKLHRWGFMRHYRGSEAGSFFHNDFRKDRLDLVEQMTCLKLDPPKPLPAVIQAPLKTEEQSGELPANETNTSGINRTTLQQSSNSATVAPLNSMVSTAFGLLLQNTNPNNVPKTTDVSPRNYGQCIDLNLQRQAPVVQDFLALHNPVDSLKRDLNAAIEAEVSRRLNERIHVAAVTTQAIARIQQQRQVESIVSSNPVNPSSFLDWKLQQLRNASALLNGQACLKSISTENSFSLATTHFKPPPVNFAVQGSIPNLSSLPRTNIQGAKTA